MNKRTTVVIGGSRFKRLREQLAEREGITDEQRAAAARRIDEAERLRTVELVPPASYAVCSEIWILGLRNTSRGYAAALGACWRGGNHPGVAYSSCSHDPKTFGQAVLDTLHERGITLDEVLEAGAVAHQLLAERVHPVKEVDELAAFFEAPAP